ncbi:hypothetical protein B6V72_18380 [Thioclava sp. F34-6]|nr:hypothetical protein B6V72_18380 [Thioclava sp. F34-6]
MDRFGWDRRTLARRRCGLRGEVAFQRHPSRALRGSPDRRLKRRPNAINRFATETKRQLDVLDRRLAETADLRGDDYTIADIAIFPWYDGFVKGWLYDAAEFLSVHEYKNVLHWADTVLERPEEFKSQGCGKSRSARLRSTEAIASLNEFLLHVQECPELSDYTRRKAWRVPRMCGEKAHPDRKVRVSVLWRNQPPS